MWRKHVLDYDDVMNQQRTIVYGMRNEALLCEEPREMIYELLEEGTNTKCDLYLNEDNTGTVRRADLLQWVNSTFPLGWGEEDSSFLTKSPAEAAQVIIAKVREMYEKKVAGERPDRVDQMERSIMLQAIDKLWQQHITDMDALREGVRLRAQGQRDPLVEYKKEAYEIFESLMSNIQYEVLNNLFRSTTNLNAFEDFLASLPDSNAEDESADVTDILGNGDLLSLLREQMSQISARAKAAAAVEPEMPELPVVPELTVEPAMPALDLPENTSVSGAPMPGVRMKAEKKLTMPRMKVMGKIKKEANPTVMAMTEEDLAELVPGVVPAEGGEEKS